MSEAPSRVPRPRLGRTPAPRRAGGDGAGARSRVRRPAAVAPTRPGSPAAAGQRARCGGRVPRRTPRRGDVHPQRDPRRAPGVLGLLAGRVRQGDLLLASSVEHSAVLHAGAWHAARGGRFATVPVDHHGRVSPAGVAASVAEHGEPAVLALQSANPEVGVLQPVDEVAASVEAPLFTDACASTGRGPFPRAGRRLPPRPTSGAGRPGWGSSWSGEAPAGATRSPATTASTSARSASRTSPAALAAAAALRATLEDRERLRRAVHDVADRAAGRGGPVDPGHRGVPRPGPPTAALLAFSCLYVDGEALVTGSTGWGSPWRAGRRAPRAPWSRATSWPPWGAHPRQRARLPGPRRRPGRRRTGWQRLLPDSWSGCARSRACPDERTGDALRHSI